MSNVGEIQSVLFKQVPGGYVFQQPNPWIFGRSSRYLVNEEQKAALLAIVTPRRPVLRGAVILAGVLLWAVTASFLVWAFSSHNEPTTLDVVAISVLIVGPMLAALIVALQRNLRRMRSILAGAPRTEERITRGELRRAMADGMSMRRVLLIVAIWSFTGLMQVAVLVIRNARHPPFSDAQSFINLFVVILAAGLVLKYLLIALDKRRTGGARAT
jgi:hypothetical protein